MTESSIGVDLKELRRKAFNTFHEDGIIDIMIGLMALIWGIMALTDDSSMSILWLVIITPGYWGMKRQYTVPRIGLVRFSSNVEGRGSGSDRALVAGLVGLGVAAGLVVFWVSAVPLGSLVFAQTYWGPIMGMATAASAALFAWLSGIRRFYLYSVMSLIVLSTAQVLGQPFGVHLILLASLILLCGFYQLRRFTVKYPVRVVDERVD